MTYDRDLRFTRVATLVLGASNLFMGIFGASRREWLRAALCFLWAVNSVVWTRAASASQQTRDEARLAQAAIRGLMEAEDHR
jgi:hypothetical protein